MKRKILSSNVCLLLFTLVSSIYYILNIIFPTDFSLDSNNKLRIYPQIAGGVMALYFVIIILLDIRPIWKNKIMKTFLIFLLLAIVYIVYPNKISSNFAFVMRSFMAILTMLALYVLIIKSRSDSKWNAAVYFVYVLQCAYCIITLILDKHIANSSNIEEFDSNSGFMLLTCIPLGLIFPVKRLRLYLLVVLVAACMYSGQRSAALSALISCPFCIYFIHKNIKIRDVIIIFIVFLTIGLPLMNDAVSNILLRNRLDIDNENMGSGRIIFWKMVIQSTIDGNVFQYIFGHGTNSVAALLLLKYGIAIGAHNGWLDIIYSYGFVGLLLYIRILSNMIHRNKTEMPLKMKQLYFILFIIFVVRASSSHGYFDISMIPFCSTIAVIEGSLYKRKQIIYKLNKRNIPDVVELRNKMV